MPLPVDPERVNDTNTLRDILRQAGFRPEYYRQVQARLELLETKSKLAAARVDVSIARAVVKRQVAKDRGKIDKISVEHAGKNAGLGGGTLVVGWATVKTVTEAYKQVKSSGLGADVWAVLKQVQPSEAQIVYAVAIAVLVFAGTLIHKATKQY